MNYWIAWIFLLLDSKWSDFVGDEVKAIDMPMELHDAIKAKVSKDAPDYPELLQHIIENM